MGVEDDVKLVKAAIAQRKVRLANGSARRKRMAEELAQGIITKTERYQWLSRTSVDVINTMGKAAKRFNDENPDDLISVQDFMDVLASAKKTLSIKQDAAEEEEEKEPDDDLQ